MGTELNNPLNNPIFTLKSALEEMLKWQREQFSQNNYPPTYNPNSGYTTSTAPQPLYSQVYYSPNFYQGGGSGYEEEAVTTNSSKLGDLIAQCGSSFYYLSSPHSRATSNEDETEKPKLWRATGKRAVGEGLTAEEAVQNLLNNLNAL